MSAGDPAEVLLIFEPAEGQSPPAVFFCPDNILKTPELLPAVSCFCVIIPT
jgi:hypothetical protein